jgi:hypothetical protein
MRNLDQCAIAQQGGAFQHVAQFPHIPRKRQARQEAQGFGGDVQQTLRLYAFEQGLCQQGNVARTLTQRWQGDGEVLKRK